MHKFLTLDSINQPCHELIENFKKIEFNSKHYESFKKEIIMVNVEKTIQAREINTNKTLKIIHLDKQLCTILSNNIKLKALLEIKL